jgi:hypothetical protein
MLWDRRAMIKNVVRQKFTPFKHRLFVSFYALLVIFSTFQWNKYANEVQDCQFDSIKRDLHLKSIEQFRRDMEILNSIREVNSVGSPSRETTNLQAKIDKDMENLEASEKLMKQSYEKIDNICSKIDDASLSLLVISLLAGGVLTALSVYQPQQREPKSKMKRKRALRNRLERVNRK